MKRIFSYTTLLIMILTLGSGQVILSASQVESAGIEKTPVMEDTGDKDKKIEKKDKKKEKKKKLKEAKEEPVVMKYEMTVTATLTRKDTFDTPKAVSVVDREKIMEKAPNNVTELLVELPGLDVNGVGANQSRPVIRGFRGQRILLLEDGIRMNNSRRQQDFGEIPALVDISEVNRVEVVRGPASVLYGSDAIGGVVNIITNTEEHDLKGTDIHGNMGYRYSSADGQNKGNASIDGHFGKFTFALSGNYRSAGDYMAPAGTLGEIELTEDASVNDTGVKDGGMNFLLNYNFSTQNQLTFKYDHYYAENAGFGFVEPELYNPGSTRIRIRYPLQEVQKYKLKYQDRQLGFILADHLSFTAYHTDNKRELDMNVFVPFGIPGMPDAGVNIGSENFTDVGTSGLRLELNKAVKTHIFTYGFDVYQDNARSTDTNSSAVIGFGPRVPVIDHTPLVPNSTYRSIGLFLQDDISLLPGTSLILGLRYQNVNASTKETTGLENVPLVDSTDQTVVGAVNLIFGVSDHLKLVVSTGRGFRSPNLIERFFNGPTPEGSGFQSRNTALKSETSFNIDVGFKYRFKNIYLESTYFNNSVYDGIRVAPSGETVNGMPEYQNINIDRLRVQGVEILGKLYFKFGLSLTANFTRIKSKDLGNPETPYVDTFSSKLNIDARYENPVRNFWLGYNLRINGDQKDVQLGDNPIGDIIPGFTVHSLSGGITLFKKRSFPMRLGLIVGNLTNTLYSEFSNASFFRPAPKRHVVLTWSLHF